ncbi:CPCC family cysteine-rich protein [Bradyrhizobium sp. GCM10023182]|uniref:CPCC family cysteine-rich protein n=2 Tax=Nitrobacteraceae TaxID=41294 RepID=UPI00361D6630
MQSSGMTFRNTIEPYSATAAYRCPCCQFRTLHERGGFEICPVCFWEDDGQDDHDAGNVRGGPNGSLSLIRARQNFKQCGASDADIARLFDLPQKKSASW